MADQEVPEDFATLFVTSLIDDETAIRDLFSKVGTVKNFRFLPQKDGQSSRAGVITMSSGAEARAAMDELKREQMDGADRTLRLIWDSRSLEKFKNSGGKSRGGDDQEAPADFATMFVMGLPADDEEAVRETFNQHGTITNMRMLTQKEGQETRAGVITMSSGEEARKAMKELKGVTIGDSPRTLKIIWDTRALEKVTGVSQKDSGGGSFASRGFAKQNGFGGGETATGFGRNAGSGAESTIISNGGTITVDGREMVPFKINSDQTVGFIYKEYANPSVPTTPATAGVSTPPEHAQEKSPVTGSGTFGRSATREPAAPTAVFGRGTRGQASGSFGSGAVHEDPPATTTENSAPEVPEKELGDIMPTAYSRPKPRAELLPRTILGAGIIGQKERDGYFSRKNVVDLKSKEQEECSFNGVPESAPTVVDVPAHVEPVKVHQPISPPNELSPLKQQSIAARLGLKKGGRTLRPDLLIIDAKSAFLKAYDESSLAAVLKKSPVVGSSILAGVRHVYDDCTVAIWIANDDNTFPATALSLKLSEELAQFYTAESKPADLGNLQAGQPLAICFKTMWYRASFVSRPETGVCKVFLVDLVEEHNVPDSDVRLLASRFGKEPIYAIRVQVAGIPEAKTPILREDLTAILMKPGSEVVSAKMISASVPVLEFVVDGVHKVPMLLVKKRLDREGRKGFIGTVMFTHGANRVYVLDDDQATLLGDFQERIQAEAKSIPALPADLRVDGLNSVLFDDDVFYRGAILSITGDKYEVDLIDYGNIFECKADRFVGMSQKLAHSDLMSDAVRLADIPEAKAMDPVLIAALKSLDETPCVYEIVSEDDIPSARLWNGEGELVGAEWMAVPRESLYPFLFEDLKYGTAYKAGDTIPVYTSHVTDPEYVFLTVGKELVIDPNLQELCDDLDATCATAPLLSAMPPVGAVVCGKFGDNWYRAVIAERMSDTRAHVFYVDYGNEEDIDLELVREMTKKWMDIPKMTIQANIMGLKPVSGDIFTLDHVDTASELLLNKPGAFKVKVLEGGIICGDLTLDDGGNVANLFVSKGIAARR